MNPRDENQASGWRGNRQESERMQGGRGGRELDEDRDWQSQQRHAGRTGASAGQRFGETYNPEPQWLREDRERESGRGEYGMGGRDEQDYGGFRGGESEYGRGSYAGSGRAWGEQQEGLRGSGRFPRAGGYDHEPGQRRGSQFYGSASGSSEGGYAGSGYAGSESRQRYYGQQREYGQRGMGGRDLGSGYGASRGGMHEYGTPGYETAGYDSDLGYTGQSMSGRGYGSQYRAGTGTGYGSSSGYQLGAHQGDLGYQRSFRGMGPQNYKRPDERIREDVHERLTENHEIDARSIMVDVNQGNVTLTGTVPERRMRYAAEDLVEGCMGVSNINNQLKVQEKESGQGTTGTGTSATGASSGTSASSESKRH